MASRLRATGHRATLLVCSLLLVLVAAQASGASQPNVVLIMPDDLSYDDFTFANPQGPRTPNIDSLARQSIRLTDFHVAPTCSPTRAALLTGRNNDAAGVWHTVMGRYFLRPNEVTLADVFKANGYRTALIGKWHLGDAYPFRPKDRGFEHVVMLKGGGIDQQPNPWGNRDNSPFTLFENDQPVTFTATNDPAAYTTDFLTTAATKFVAGCQQRGENFFLYLPYNVAHIPHSLPPDARPGADAHTATVENMDKNIGRLLASLDSAGLASNTVVLFLTDNGMANRRFRGDKATEYEAGHRVPCFIRWPAGGIVGDKSEAREVAQLTTATDVLPTLMDLLNLKDVASRPAEVPLHGRSLKSLLDANPANDDAALHGRIVVVDNQRMDDLVKFRQACVMQDEFDAAGKIAHKWRLNRPAANKPWELYDVQADAQQATNLLAQSPGEPDNKLVQTLETAYENWWREISANAAEYVRPVLGAPAETDSCLYAHDWHMDKGLPPWNHTAIAAGAKANGFHAVTFANAGKYTFDLRRWPREIAGETTMTSRLKTPIRSAKDNQPVAGEALPIHSARIRIWQGDKVIADEKQDIASDSDGAVFKVQVPAGPASVQTWFYDAEGKELCGAYYIYVQRSVEVIQQRSGLQRSAHAFATTGQGRVAFLGGSITEMDGYRPRVAKALAGMFPQTKFDFINAGISSTGSTTGAFRLATDVLNFGKVDLLFVEFAVNDNQDAREGHNKMRRAMEGIVRQARRSNPDMDIVFLYTANESHISDFQVGRTPVEIAAHESVAEHYDLPAVCLALDVALRMKAGEFDWQQFGGVHPAPFGAELYAARIGQLLTNACVDSGVAATRSLPAAFRNPNYDYGHFLDLKAAQYDSGWTLSEPDWKNLPGATRKQFVGCPMLCADTPNASLRLGFEGSAIGMYLVSGPDAGSVEYRIDGSPAKMIDLYTKHSGGLHYPWTCMFASNLKAGAHELTLRVVPDKNPASQGTAVRIKTFVVNGTN